VTHSCRPLSYPGRVGDRGTEQALDAQFLSRLREGGVQTLRVLPEQVDLGRIGAELRRPFHPDQIADQEPALGILEP
jgi:hypothetical protein